MPGELKLLQEHTAGAANPASGSRKPGRHQHAISFPAPHAQWKGICCSVSQTSLKRKQGRNLRGRNVSDVI